MEGFAGDGRDMAAELGATANMPAGPYQPFQSVRTVERGGWPARSPSGQAFAAGVAPRVGTGQGLINDPLPIVMHHRAEMGFVGRSVIANINPDPVYTPLGFPAPIPIGQMPEIDLTAAWADPDELLGAPYGK
jgi:hypothetical protein